MGCHKLTYHIDREALGQTCKTLLRVVGKNDAALKNGVNYYPFGATMPGRTYTSSNKYRYGFSGKEMDDAGKAIEGKSAH